MARTVYQLAELIEKAAAEFERWYTRMRRACTNLHKAKRRLARLEKERLAARAARLDAS